MGQAARLVIGQRTFTEQKPPTEEVPAGADFLGGVGGIAFANNMLFVADSNRVSSAPLNNRVLIYRDVSAFLPTLTAMLPQGARCPACVGTASTVIGQADFNVNALATPPTSASLRTPTAVGSDGSRLVIADTDNNRVLVWNSIPGGNNQPADIVLGQENFTSGSAPTRGALPGQRLRGPQGVWIQGNRLFVADTGHNRVLIWNSFPTRNYQPADLVVGQPDFNTAVELDLTQTEIDPKSNNLVNPVSVSSDGQRLFVADLGQNRVLIWNTIPTANGQAADLVLGQPDFTSAVANNSSKLCESNGTDEETGDLLYPTRCLGTMDFPRAVIGDGTRLFIADSGNDRILVYNTMPIANAQKPDLVLGQQDGESNRTSETLYPGYTASADLLRTPMGLAWDGTNLFVSDTYNRRILVYSPADQELPYTAVRNAASLAVYSIGTVTFGGTLTTDNEITITISEKEYKYKIVADDSTTNVINTLRDQINADPDATVSATSALDVGVLLLTAKVSDVAGDAIEYSAAVTPDTATVTVTTAGSTLSGGQNASQVAAGTLVTVLGENLSETTAAAPSNATDLPRTLGGVRLYVDGIAAPLLYVSPTQVNAQIPWEVVDATGSNAYLRIERAGGAVTVTSPVAVPVVSYNPGIFTSGGTEPRPAVLLHYSNSATGTVSVDGSVTVGETAIVTIEDRTYSYKTVEGDELSTVRDKLVELINAREDEKVRAYPAGVFARIRLQAKQEGEAGNGIPYSATSTGVVTNDVAAEATIILTPTTTALCCANVAGSLVNTDNPALPGETIVAYATGLGILTEPSHQETVKTGHAYDGPPFNNANEAVYAMAGGRTANTLYSGLLPGAIGIYEVHLELNSDLPTNEFTQMTIASDLFVSNVVTFPVLSVKPVTPPPAEASTAATTSSRSRKKAVK